MEFSFYILSFLHVTLSKFHFENVLNKNHAKGTLFFQIDNKYYTIETNENDFIWFRNHGIKLCESFLKIPIFYGLIELNLDSKLTNAIRLTELDNFCQ